MNFIKRIVNLGLTQSLSESEKRGIKVLNIINFLTLLLILLMAVNVNILELSIYNLVTALSLAFIMSIPLVLNYYRKTILSRVIFIILSYVVIITSSIIYGGDLHFQYFIVVGISLPLIFFDKEIGYYKWLLVLVAMPIGLFQEWYFVMYKPLIVMSDESIYWIRLFNDIILFLTILVILLVFTNQNYKQYRKIEKSNLKLQQNNLELNQFAHIISHDLKVPLRRINSLTDIIVHDYQDSFDEDLYANFELIKSSVKKMDRLIISVLEYSKAGRDGVDISTFDTKSLFKDIVSILDPPIGIRFTFPSDNTALTGSYAQLHQVLVNLIENAIKYHDKVDGVIKISIKEVKNNILEFEIKDNGPGIQEHFHEKLLQIFQTANNNSELNSTGLGLAIVKKLVEQNGGKLSFKSVYGEGSSFLFTWPMNINQTLGLIKYSL